jgi:hypothetical protein
MTTTYCCCQSRSGTPAGPARPTQLASVREDVPHVHLQLRRAAGVTQPLTQLVSGTAQHPNGYVVALSATLAATAEYQRGVLT